LVQEQDARIRRLVCESIWSSPTHKHRAGATVTFGAADLRASESKSASQEISERITRLAAINPVRLAVDDDRKKIPALGTRGSGNGLRID
jgi:hypothetical protein